ncbi:hypothetical protein PROFUN_12812 [Planoprotostelium fungivorum]|uniref:U1-type domain-containing protein n=1 Tax=Planoprotostelium fungivorum TaxID=1890364 RepID=A0A2P6N6P0_9EUKA|nr:hypothetical protein PROFUN_12812 [Planoprotostelium fungivorum]
MSEKKQAQWRFCRSCKRNLEQRGNEHNYTKKHKDNLIQKMNQIFTDVKGQKYFLNHITLSATNGETSSVALSNASALKPTSEDTSWYCFICDVTVHNEKTNAVGFEAIKHLASKSHHKQVDSFWYEAGVGIVHNQLKLNKQKFYIKEDRFQQFIIEIKKKRKEEEEKKEEEKDVPPIDEKIIAAALAPPPEDIQEIQKPAKAYETVYNASGIAQNGTGFNEEGNRVWGGGIVKVKRDMWLSWPIDELEDELDKRKVELGIVVGKASETPSSSGFRTVHATGENLKSLGARVLAPGEGNVHSGAVPPWLKSKSDLQRATNSGKMFAIAHNGRRGRALKPQKLGAELVRGENGVAASKNFLPKFGGVWQLNGSRGDNRRDFLENRAVQVTEKKEEKEEEEKNFPAPMMSNVSERSLRINLQSIIKLSKYLLSLRFVTLITSMADRNKRSYKERFRDIVDFQLPLEFINRCRSIKGVSPASHSAILAIEQDTESASCIWDASLVMSSWFCQQDEEILRQWKNSRCLEIGSGCGLSGIVMSATCAEMIATDLGEVMPILHRNVDKSGSILKELLGADGVNIKSQELFWGNDCSALSPPFDIIIGSDIVYEIQAFDLLVKTLRDLSGPDTIIYISLEHRWKDVERFFFAEIDQHFVYDLTSTR